MIKGWDYILHLLQELSVIQRIHRTTYGGEEINEFKETNEVNGVI